MGNIVVLYFFIHSLYGRRLASAGALLFAVLPALTHHAIATNTLFAANLLSLIFLSSFWLMVLSARAKTMSARVAFALISLAAMVIHLSMSEYYASAELMRPAVLWLVLRPVVPGRGARVKRALLWWLMYIPIYAGIVFHRLFIYQGSYHQSSQTAALTPWLQSPIRQLVFTVVHGTRDLYQLFVSSWVPHPEILFDTLPRWALVAAPVVGLGVGLLTFAAMARLGRNSPDACDKKRASLAPVGHGLLYVMTSMLVLWLTGNFFPVEFGMASCWAFIPAAGTVVVLAALLYRAAANPKVAAVTLAVVVALAAMLQFRTSAYFARRWDEQRVVWDQVRLRCPHIEKGTSLIVDEPVFKGFFVRAYELTPLVNLIYSNESKEYDLHASPILGPGLQLTRPEDQGLLEPETSFHPHTARGFTPNGKALLIYYDRPSGVVYIPDKELPILPGDAPLYVRFWAQRSDTTTIGHQRTTEDLVAQHGIWNAKRTGWADCFQEIQLLRQLGDWEALLAVANRAQADRLVPMHKVDYLPVLDACLHLALEAEATRYVDLLTATGPYERHLLRRLLQLRKNDLPLAGQLAAGLDRATPQ